MTGWGQSSEKFGLSGAPRSKGGDEAIGPERRANAEEQKEMIDNVGNESNIVCRAGAKAICCTLMRATSRQCA